MRWHRIHSDPRFHRTLNRLKSGQIFRIERVEQTATELKAPARKFSCERTCWNNRDANIYKNRESRTNRSTIWLGSNRNCQRRRNARAEELSSHRVVPLEVPHVSASTVGTLGSRGREAERKRWRVFVVRRRHPPERVQRPGSKSLRPTYWPTSGTTSNHRPNNGTVLVSTVLLRRSAWNTLRTGFARRIARFLGSFSQRRGLRIRLLLGKASGGLRNELAAVHRLVFLPGVERRMWLALRWWLCKAYRGLHLVRKIFGYPCWGSSDELVPIYVGRKSWKKNYFLLSNETSNRWY